MSWCAGGFAQNFCAFKLQNTHISPPSGYVNLYTFLGILVGKQILIVLVKLLKFIGKLPEKFFLVCIGLVYIVLWYS